jgi:hypothetical protein
MVRSQRTTGKRRMGEMRKMPLFVPSANACSRFVLRGRETGRKGETRARARDWGILVQEGGRQVVLVRDEEGVCTNVSRSL